MAAAHLFDELCLARLEAAPKALNVKKNYAPSLMKSLSVFHLTP